MTAQTAEAAVATPVVPAPAAPEAPKAPEAKAPEAPVEAKPVEAEKPADAEKKPDLKVEKTEDPKPGKVAKAFADLGKKEKALVESQRKFAAEREQLAQQKADLERYVASLKAEAAKADEFAKFMKTARRNPAKAAELLKQLDVSYDDISQLVLSEGKMTPEMEARAAAEEAKAEARRAAEELAEFKRQQAEAREAAKRAAVEREQKAAEATLERFRSDAVAFVKDHGVDYELILQNGAEDEVPKLVETYFHQTGKVLTLKDAADQVEDFLLKRLEQVTSSQKWTRLQAERAKPVQAPSAPAPVPAPAQATITNEMAPVTKPVKMAPLTEEERIKRAVEAFNKARGK